jgi:alcohol dehydrogenase (cytochrome c)
VSPPILVDYRRNGRTIKGLIDVARDGYLWFLERSAGPIKFVEGKPYVYQNVFRSLDPVTGRPDVDPAHKPGTGTRAEYCPNAHGGKNWPPIAFSPRTRMIYVPANNNLCGSNLGAPTTYTPGRAFVGVTGSQPFAAPGADHFGEVQAWNVDTGQKVWTHNYARSPNWGSMLATAGGLVFSGGTNDRKLHAFDASTGSCSGSPHQLGDPGAANFFPDRRKQHIAVESDGARLARDECRAQSSVPGEFPEGGGPVWVVALSKLKRRTEAEIDFFF